MRREPKHQVQEEDEGEGLPRELKMERWAHQGAEDVNLLRELSMLDIFIIVIIIIIIINCFVLLII